MGDIADAVKDAQNSTDTAVVALDICEATVSTVANIAGAFTGIIGVVGLVKDLIGGSSQMTHLQQSVDLLLAKFQTLYELVRAADELSRNRDVATKLGTARAQLRPIQEADPRAPDFSDTSGDMKTNTAAPLEILVQAAYWKRPFLQEGVYHDAWAGDMAPPHEGGIVFDYISTLPAFVEAIAIRICVLRVLFPDFPGRVADELKEWAEKLEAFHDAIADGIVMERPPSISETDETDTDPVSLWDFKGRTFGAVETYSAYASVSKYPVNRTPPFPVIGFQLSYKNFLARHALASASRWKRVYAAIGLRAAFSMILRLKALAGVPLTRTTDFSAWSLREANRLVRMNIFGTVDERAPIRLKELAGLVDLTGSVSIRTMLDVNL